MPIRRLDAAPMIFALASACAPNTFAPRVQCESRFDCAKDESCVSGSCVPSTIDETRIQKDDDAGVSASPDSGPSAAPDVGTTAPPPRDAGTPDSGSGAGGGPAASDAGALVCPTAPVTVTLGTTTSSYCTIVEALAAAPEFARVTIPAGRWAEPVQVITRGVAIEGRGIVTIAGDGTVPGVRLNAEGAALRSIAIEAGGNLGLEITASATVEDVTVTGAVAGGIWVSAVGAVVTLTRVTVSAVRCDGDCTAMNYGEGIVALSGATVNLIDSQVADSDYSGVYSNGATLRIENTIIRGNGRSKCRQNLDLCMPGVMAATGSNLTISRNTQVRENGGCGVQVLAATSMVMRDSASFDNGIRIETYVDGVWIDGTAATLENNTVSGNLGYGIGCLNNARVTSCGTNDLTGNAEGWTSGTCTGC